MSDCWKFSIDILYNFFITRITEFKSFMSAISGHAAVMILCAEVWNELKCVVDTSELQDVSQSVVTADGSSWGRLPFQWK